MEKYIRDHEILKRILRYCDRIQDARKRFGDSFEQFSSDFHYHNSCAMCLLQIGELANRLSGGQTAALDCVPWRKIIGARNLLAHDYEHFKLRKAWEVVRDDIAPLRAVCLRAVLVQEPDYDPASEEELLNDEEE
jgi:uncharacterized protein with HEPN domain